MVDENNNPTGVHIWEFKNTVNNNWYECRDQAIPWIDGRLVRMEIATDITHRKAIEADLKQAKEDAEKRATTDELTQIRNRRSFFEESKALIEKSKGEVSLVMLDIDDFKIINDTNGHVSGDIVLQEIAKLINTSIRQDDIFGRVGGEEFALFLPNSNFEASHAIAEDLRQKISDYTISIDEVILSVTCSFGVATLSNATFEEVYAGADNALYVAKTNGRNRVEVYN